jgi:hypothetical protein
MMSVIFNILFLEYFLSIFDLYFCFNINLFLSLITQFYQLESYKIIILFCLSH